MKNITVGVDEVGRGCVAGPLVFCFFLIKTTKEKTLLELYPKRVLRDSKKLTEKRRLEIYHKVSSLKETGDIDYFIVQRDASFIDSFGLSAAIQDIFKEGFILLKQRNITKENSRILLDGALPKEYGEVHVKGDEKFIPISLASIVAKTSRDFSVREMENVYPGYGWGTHVGYGTKRHYEAIKKLGLTPLHRKTFLTKLLS
jgi:ribonuclease HII